MDNTKPRQKLDRVIDKVFTDQATGITVQVRKLPLPQPQYSFAVGTIGKNGFAPYLRSDVKVENGKVTVAPVDQVVSFLLAEARLYVLDQKQKMEDFYFERRLERETRQAERAQGNQDVVRTGKTEREAAKRARHEQNLITRRAEDQARTSASKSGRAR